MQDHDTKQALAQYPAMHAPAVGQSFRHAFSLRDVTPLPLEPMSLGRQIIVNSRNQCAATKQAGEGIAERRPTNRAMSRSKDTNG
jgi:hypothetical protein